MANESPGGCQISVKVMPNAPRDEIAGRLGDAVKIRIHAPALEGRANEALISFLAKRLALTRRAITVARGERSAHKVLRIEGLGAAEIQRRLGV